MKKALILLMGILLAVGMVNAAVVVDEDFSDGVADGWSEPYGVWGVSGGEYHSSTATTPLGDISISFYPATLSHTVAEARVKYVNQIGSFDYISLMVRTNPAVFTGYGFEIENDAQYAEIYRADGGGARTHLNQAELPEYFQTGVWYDLKFVAEGSTLKGYINDELVVQATDSTFAAGYPGLLTVQASSAGQVLNVDFDDVLAYDDALYTVTESLSGGYTLTDQLGNAVSATTSDSILQVRDGSGNVVTEFSPSGNFDISGLTLDQDGTRVFTDYGSSTGIESTHSLLIPNTMQAGVYVCPDASSIAEVDSTNCANRDYFSDAECLAGTTHGSIDCEIVELDFVDYYKVNGLANSGLGEGCIDDLDCVDPPTCDSSPCVCNAGICQLDLGGGEVIPEFSTIGMVLALLIVFLGTVYVVKKK